MSAKLGNFILRDPHPWEGQQVFAMTGDAVVMQYMGFKMHETVDEATALIERYRDAPGRFQAVCLDADPNDVLGIVGLEVQGHQAAMTIMFRRGAKARGMGRVISVPFVEWIFTHPTIWRVWAYCHVDNIPVQRVLERMGAVCEGRLRRFAFFPNISTEEPQDVFTYSIIRG